MRSREVTCRRETSHVTPVHEQKVVDMFHEVRGEFSLLVKEDLSERRA